MFARKDSETAAGVLRDKGMETKDKKIVSKTSEEIMGEILVDLALILFIVGLIFFVNAAFHFV